MTKEYLISKIIAMECKEVTDEPMTFGPNTTISFHTTKGLNVCSVSIKEKRASVIKIELLPLNLIENSQIHAYAETLLKATNFVSSINSENKS